MPVMQGCYAGEFVGSCSVEDGEVACLEHLEGAELGFIQDLTGKGILFSQNTVGGKGLEGREEPGLPSS